MEVAVCINTHKLVAFGKSEACLGRLARLQTLSLISLCALDRNPLDIVVVYHGMLCAAYFNVQGRP